LVFGVKQQRLNIADENSGNAKVDKRAIAKALRSTSETVLGPLWSSTTKSWLNMRGRKQLEKKY